MYVCGYVKIIYFGMIIKRYYLFDDLLLLDFVCVVVCLF